VRLALLLDFAESGSLLLQRGAEDRAEAIVTLNDSMMRIMTSPPPSKDSVHLRQQQAWRQGRRVRRELAFEARPPTLERPSAEATANAQLWTARNSAPSRSAGPARRSRREDALRVGFTRGDDREP
jgi:hypothetical protein